MALNLPDQAIISLHTWRVLLATSPERMSLNLSDRAIITCVALSLLYLGFYQKGTKPIGPTPLRVYDCPIQWPFISIQSTKAFFVLHGLNVHFWSE